MGVLFPVNFSGRIKPYGDCKKMKKNQAGFTLIELLVVIAILGILAAVAIPNLQKFMKSGEVEAAKTELSIVQTSVVAYIADNDGAIPEDVTDLSAYLTGGSDTLGWEYTFAADGTATQGVKK